jgi:hypothetical protein
MMLGLLVLLMAPFGVGTALPPDGLLRRLLAALEEAEEAEGMLERARMAYATGPTEARLDRVRDASRWALQKEVEFDTLWTEALAIWQAEPPRLR